MKRLFLLLALTLTLSHPAGAQTPAPDEQRQTEVLTLQRTLVELQRRIAILAPPPVSNSISSQPAPPSSTVASTVAQLDDSTVGMGMIALITVLLLAAKKFMPPEKFAALKNWLPGASTALGLAVTNLSGLVDWSPKWGVIIGLAAKGLQSAVDGMWPNTTGSLLKKQEALAADAALLAAKIAAKPVTPAAPPDLIAAREAALEAELAKIRAAKTPAPPA